ncbi:DevR family CRISPR-associated autoregulator [Myxococcota bacterium]|nr:DevR family CRISPR-associated autoregulator [Myxococcota bacterium]
MTKHLYGLISTSFGVAANNRGENEGHISTLQKILWHRDDVHTTVSAEAIRFAVRDICQKKGLVLNRTWFEHQNQWADPKFEQAGTFWDDDVLGFMSAEAAKQDGGEADVAEKPKPQASTGKPKNKKAKPRGTTLVRRSRLEISRAVSLSPFRGEVSFNSASIGATPSASSTGKDPVPYGTEIHATRYQYAFALTPEELAKKERALDVVDILMQLSHVAGNQSRFLYDFSPDSVIFRWTDDFAPRMLYAFEQPEGTELCVPSILQRVQCGDIEPKELVIGGAIASAPDGHILQKAGATVVLGVRQAANEIIARIKKDLGL